MSRRVRPVTQWFDTPPRTPTASSLAGVLVAAVAFAGFGSSPGLIAAVTLLAAWLALPAEYVFAVGQVMIAAVVSGSVDPRLLVGAQTGLALLLAASIRDATNGARALVVWIALYAVAGLAVLSATRQGDFKIWQVALALWVVAVIAAYGLHRHEIVALGLTGGDDE